MFSFVIHTLSYRPEHASFYLREILAEQGESHHASSDAAKYVK